MLGKSKSTAPVVQTSTRTMGTTTIIGPGAVFDGNLSTPEGIRIDGIINGNCTCGGDMIIGNDGRIEGNITAQNVNISGKVNGDITVSGKMELFSTGRVVGNITAKALVIDENAYFDGRCTMTAALEETAHPSMSLSSNLELEDLDKD